MGKRRCLEIEEYAGDTTGNTRRRMRQSEIVQSNKKTPSLSKHSFGIGSHSLRAYCRLREIDVRDPERSMEFIRFLHIQMSSWRRNEAKTLRWDPCDRVLDRFDRDGKGGRVGTADTTLSTARVEAKTVGAVSISRFISNISGFIPSHTAMELK